MPWVRLQFSLDCIDEPINDWLVGVPGHTRRMLETLQLTKELGLRFSCNSVLTAFNYREGMALIPFLMDNFGDQVRRISVTPYGQSIYRHDPSLNLPDFAIREVEESVSAFKERYPGPQITFSGGVAQPVDDSLDERRRRYRSRAQCTANRNAFILLPDGQVTVCEELYYHPAFLIGDLRRQSIMEMWQSEAALALVNPQRADVPDGACALCPDFDECNTGLGRCYKKTLQAYGYDRPHWPDPSCPYAPPAGAG
jgi:radical SAM protein with 4Fe4S-binding SPASM domain